MKRFIISYQAIFCLLLTVFFLYSNGFCQNIGTIANHDYNAPATNSKGSGSGQGQVGINVDHFTGKIQLNIPLGNAGDIFTDVSLSYSSGGFKPSTPSSVLGLGWNLNCGGAITRQVRGIPDEILKQTPNDVDPDLPGVNSNIYVNFDRIANFNPLQPYHRLDNGQAWEPQEDRYLERMANGLYDTEVDIFSVNAPGINCSFYLKGSGGFAPPQLIKIGAFNLEIIPDYETISFTPPGGGTTVPIIKKIKSFQVKALDGSKYFFTKPFETSSKVKSYRSGLDMFKNLFNVYLNPLRDLLVGYSDNTVKNDNLPTAWLLEKIEVPGKPNILYSYFDCQVDIRSHSSNRMKNPVFVQPIPTSKTEDWFVGKIPKDITTEYEIINQYSSPNLQSISTGNTRVIFKYSPYTTNNLQGPNILLEGIQFFNLGLLAGYVELDYTVTRSNNTVSRSLLDKLEFFDRFHNSKGPIKFEYFNGTSTNINQGFPRSDENRLDHWGYFNGQAIGDFFNLTENQRNERGKPNLEFGRLGMIKRIISIEKSITTIDYEQNLACENILTYFWSWGFAGGLRVSKIKNLAVSGSSEKVREFKYGHNNPNSNLIFKGGFAVYPQINKDTLSNDYKFGYSKKSQLGLVILGSPYDDFEWYSAVPITVNYELIQSTPIFQLEDEAGRSVVYTYVKEIKEDQSYSIFTFSEPEFETYPSTNLCSGLRLQIPTGNTNGNFQNQYWLDKYNYNYVNDPVPKLTSISGNSQLFDGSFGISTASFPHFPEEIINFNRYKFRSNLTRRIKTNKQGGDLLSINTFAADNFLLQKIDNIYQFQQVSELKGIFIRSLLNFHGYVYGYLLNRYDQYKIVAKEQYFKEEYPGTGRTMNSRSVFVFGEINDIFGTNVLTNSTTINYERKYPGNGFGLKIVEEKTLISDQGNLRRHGKPIQIVNKTFGINGSAEKLFMETMVCFRYPSDFLDISERNYLENSVFNNSLFYGNGLNINRETFALSYLCNGVQEEGPFETYSYLKKDLETDWTLTGIQLSIPYAWGDLTLPKIGSRHVYSYPINSFIKKNQSNMYPVGFQPLEWNPISGFQFDPGYEKISDVLEIDLHGRPLTTCQMIKKANGTYFYTEPSGQILGYNKTEVIAEVAMAKSTECSFSSFEMPITNSQEENGWTVYTPSDGNSIPRCQIKANEAHSGGNSILLNNSFGPTLSLEIFKNDLKDYKFEVWIKTPDPNKIAPFALGGYFHKEGSFSSISATYTIKNEQATGEWKKYEIIIPVSQATDLLSVNEKIFIRVFVQSLKMTPSDPNHPDWTGVLVDDCRLFPKSALMKNTIFDLRTSSSSQIDAKGKKIETKVSLDRVQNFDQFGNLRDIQIINQAK